MGVSDSYHLLGYQVVALAFFIAWARCTIAMTGRRRVTTSALLLSVSLFLGFLLYQATTLVFFEPASDLFGVNHLSSLLTHLLGICWNVSTVLLALRWRDGRWSRRKILALALFATLACATLIACFVAIYPGPPGHEYIVTIAALPLGKLYSSTYAVSMLLTKILVVSIVVPQIRRMRSAVARDELILIAAGSALIACFALIRLVLGLKPPNGTSPASLELLPFLPHIAGTLLYVAGIALVDLTATTRAQARAIGQHARLMPLCRSGLAVFPAVGASPTLRARDMLSVDRADAQLLAAIVLLLDIEVLLSRSDRHNAPERPTNPPSAPAASLHADHDEQRLRLLEAARRFRDISARSPLRAVAQHEAALREALFVTPPQTEPRRSAASLPEIERCR